MSSLDNRNIILFAPSRRLGMTFIGAYTSAMALSSEMYKYKFDNINAVSKKPYWQNLTKKSHKNIYRDTRQKMSRRYNR